MLASVLSRDLLVLLALAGPMVSTGTALGRDERRAERVTADDDPVLIPRSALPKFPPPGALAMAGRDPDTAGWVTKPAGISRPRCTMLAWFPERSPDREYEEMC